MNTIQFTILLSYAIVCSISASSFYSSDLKGYSNIYCDYIIIAAPDLLPEADTLANYRYTFEKDRVESPVVISALDIKTQFDNGKADIHRIKDFMIYVDTAWNCYPRNVLLLGDVSLDSNISETGFYLPTTIRNEKYNETIISDKGLVTWGHELFGIGRIPADSKQKFYTYFSKLKKFEATQNTGNKKILYITDLFAYDPYAVFYDWGMSIIRMINPSYDVISYHSVVSSDYEGMKSKIFDAIKNGVKYVHYYGNSSVSVWGIPEIINFSKDLESFPEGSFFILNSFTEFNAAAHKSSESIAEKLLFSENRGAVAVTSGTGTSTIGSMSRAQSGFIEELNRNIDRNEYGSVWASTKRTHFVDNYKLDPFMLLGDPAIIVTQRHLNILSDDTIQCAPGDSISITGKTKIINDGTLKVMNYGLSKLYDTLFRGDTIRHFGNRPVLDSLSTPVTSYRFDFRMKAPVIPDTSQLYKISLYANNRLYEEFGAVFIKVNFNGTSVSVARNKNPRMDVRMRLINKSLRLDLAIPDKTSYGVYLLDLAGRVVFQKQFKYKTAVIPTDKLPTGLFIVKIKYDNVVCNSKISIIR